jgi:quinoprotein glucose dehydrogenase
MGGPIITAGGLVFVAGTTDSLIRGFEVETGKELWNAPLPPVETRPR